MVTATVLTTAVPASAGWRSTYGTYPNGVTYFIEIDVTSSYVSAHAQTSSNYSEGTLYIAMCSGTGVCSSPPTVIASNRNYNTYDITTGNPTSFGHTYKACFSAKFGTTTYSNYCTALAAP